MNATSYPLEFQAIIRVAEHFAKVDESSIITPWHLYIACMMLDHWNGETSPPQEGTLAYKVWGNWQSPFGDFVGDDDEMHPSTKLLQSGNIPLLENNAVTDLLNNEKPLSLSLSQESECTLDNSLLMCKVLHFSANTFSLSHSVFLGVIINDAGDERVQNSLSSLETDLKDMIKQFLESLVDGEDAEDVSFCGGILVQALCNSNHTHKIRSIIEALINESHGKMFCDALVSNLIFGVHLDGDKITEVSPSNPIDVMLSITLGVAILAHDDSDVIMSRIKKYADILRRNLLSDTMKIALINLLNTLPLPKSEG